ncbi:fumarylacetoacetate hydrolase family protein [Nisaea acidiphila]|uniref:Fumarylacetoacetate hydrolase family protein n=1 Tax=Nisaea acidiphila TaxID=1862145 RepID=A0A9J7AZ91_9PROT|nr:fumarylacetoacetate hydrolase family protein [Nisaea acidiphila]UUX51745.1 fumarylacetoacetate hydrolase family protein [Nisaea acidiphila]
MRFASFNLNGKATWGLATDSGLHPVDAATEERFPTLRSAIAADALASVGAALAGTAAAVTADEADFLPLIPDPDKILCIGLNYEAHRIEGGWPVVEHPTIFLRLPNSQIGHRQPMIRPKVSETLDYEAELAVVIGKGGRYISEAGAMDHVAGYACYNEGSVREWQRHTQQFTPGKNFIGTGAFGPWLVTPDEIDDLGELVMEARLNGEVMQHTKLDDLIFPIPRLIEYISTFTELVPGDVIVTGTPGGVGGRREPPVWMKPGDEIVVEIDKIGLLSNPVVAET